MMWSMLLKNFLHSADFQPRLNRVCLAFLKTLELSHLLHLKKAIAETVNQHVATW